jgi:hypothetical protein
LLQIQLAWQIYSQSNGRIFKLMFFFPSHPLIF